MENNIETQTADPIKTHPKTANSKPKWVLFSLLAALLIVCVGGTYFFQQQKINDLDTKLNRQKTFTAMPNQACPGVRTVPENKVLPITKLSATRTLSDTNTQGIVAKFDCHIGQNTKNIVEGMAVAAVDRNGLEMGAEAIYFTTAEQANKYHQDKINPERYWSVPNNSLSSDIPAFKYFVSYVFGESLYFDAYAVKGNVILRVTLPCDDTSDAAQELCLGDSVDAGAAIATLKAFANSVQPLKL